MIETISWLIVGVGMVFVGFGYLMSMTMLAYFAWVGFRVMVRVDLTPKAVRAMRVGEMSIPIHQMSSMGFTSDDIAAAIEFGQKASISNQKIGEA